MSEEILPLLQSFIFYCIAFPEPTTIGPQPDTAACNLISANIGTYKLYHMPEISNYSEQLKQAISDTMQDVVTLPVTLSERRSARHRQEAYLAFSLIAIKRTGIPLNQVTIATAYAAFRARQGLPGDDSHKNWFSENPVWLAALWKRAGVVVEAR